MILTEDVNQDLVTFLVVTATDPEGEQLVFDLSGEDAGVFEISDFGGISIVEGAGPIAPGDDADGDGDYEVLVTVSDPQGLTDTVLLDIIISAGG